MIGMSPRKMGEALLILGTSSPGQYDPSQGLGRLLVSDFFDALERWENAEKHQPNVTGPDLMIVLIRALGVLIAERVVQSAKVGVELSAIDTIMDGIRNEAICYTKASLELVDHVIDQVKMMDRISPRMEGSFAKLSPQHQKLMVLSIGDQLDLDVKLDMVKGAPVVRIMDKK